MKTGSIVPLHAKESTAIGSLGNRLLGLRLGRLIKVPFARVFFQSHRSAAIMPAFSYLEHLANLRTPPGCLAVRDELC
jgi:hypothetical protein